MKKIIYCLVISMLYVIVVRAEEPKVQDPNSTQWWLKSPLDHTELYGQMLYHVEGSYSFSNMTGNIEGDVHKGQILNFLRYNAFSFHLNYMLDKYSITTYSDNSGNPKAAKTVTTDHQVAEFAVDYNISKYFNLETGIIWEMDQKQSVLDRWSYYAGVGYNHHFGNHYLDFIVAGGMVDIDYTLPSIELDQYDVQREPDAYLFLIQSYSWAVTKGVMLKEQFQYFPNLSESQRYRYNIDLTMLFNVWEFLSVMIEHNRSYNNDATNVGVYNKDTKTLIGIQLQY